MNLISNLLSAPKTSASFVRPHNSWPVAVGAEDNESSSSATEAQVFLVAVQINVSCSLTISAFSFHHSPPYKNGMKVGVIERTFGSVLPTLI
jgi:hypothetical protein